MSDVPPTARRLRCLLCGDRLAKYPGLVWHRLRMHRTAAPQLGGGHPPAAVAHARAGSTSVRETGGAAESWGGSAARMAPLAPPSPPPPARDEDGDAGRTSADGEQHGGSVSPPPPPQAPAPPGGETVTDAAAGGVAPMFDFGDNTCAEAVEKMDAIIQLTRRAKEPEAPPRKKRKGADGDAHSSYPGYQYATLAAEVRQHYEDLHDWDSRRPLVTKRKACHPGRFDSYRLRLVQNFAFTCSGGGMSLADQEKLFNLLDAWDRTQPGQPVDAGHFLGIRDTFGTKTSFQDALRDDIDHAVEDEGWLKADLEEGGESYPFIFRPAMEVALARMRVASKIRLWSGGDRPAPPTNKREEPMDGDAFRNCEAEVVNDNDENSFVLGLHAFSDASRVSESGGTFLGGDGVLVRAGQDRGRVHSFRAVGDLLLTRRLCYSSILRFYC